MDLVTLNGDEAVTTTLAIAEGTENDHASVIKLVRTYLADLEEFGSVAFETRSQARGNSGFEIQNGEGSDLKSHPSGAGRPTEYAKLNEQQSTLLLTYMRNGDVVRGFKKRLVHAFFQMAQQLAARKFDPAAVLADPAAMRGLLLTYTEKVLALEEVVAVQAPKVATHDRIAAAEGSLCMRDAAKALQMRPIDLKNWLIVNRWIYGRPGHSGWLAYQDRIMQGVMCHKVSTVQREDGTEKVVEQPRITSKGLTRIGNALAKTPSAA